MFSRFQTEYHSNCPTFLKGRLYPVWVSSNFDPLLPNLHPLFTENIQYSQGFAVLYPMNMHFNASIYNFGFPNYRRSFHVTLSCIVLYRCSCKLEHHETILHYGVLCVLFPRGSIVGQKFCVFIDYRRFFGPVAFSAPRDYNGEKRNWRC